MRLSKDNICDINTCRTLQQLEIWGDDYIALTQQFEKDTMTYLNHCLDHSLYFFGLFCDSNLVCICGIELMKNLPELGNTGKNSVKIVSLFTLPAYRRRGLANQLFQEVLTYAADTLHAGTIWLETENSFMMAYYKSLGFEQCGSLFIRDAS